MTVKHCEVGDCNLRVKSQVLNDLISIFLVRPRAYTCSDTYIKALHLELQTTNFKEITRIQQCFCFVWQFGV